MKYEEDDGYCMDGLSCITLPFADDFNLITRDVRKHKKLMVRLHELTGSMGLKLKPRKCRSLSIRAGKSVEIGFSLGESVIGSILHDRCHKFLGGIYTFDFSVTSVASVIKDRVSDQLKNIDDLLVRNEYKARIYIDYFLGSLRFILSVHDLHISQLKALDDLTHRYLKKWLGLPQCASWALVHDAHGMNVKSISQLYKECRALNLSKIRVFSDERAKRALDSKEEREGKWLRKFSSAIFTKGLLQDVVTPVNSEENVSTVGNALDDSSLSWGSLDVEGILSPAPASASLPLASPTAPIPPPPPPPPPPPRQVNPNKQLKRSIQTGVQQGVTDFWKEKVSHYVMQGDYLALIMEEGNCISWRSYMWDIPQGVLKFAINAGINTLPSFDNLKRWGKRTSDRCPFCGNIQTLAHILSNCSVCLDQGRYTWRHNSVLSSLIAVVRPRLLEGFTLYSDMPGYQAPHGGTIPPHILVTSLRPDLFIVNEITRTAIIFELTCPWDRNIDRSHSYKEEKYAPLSADLSVAYKVFTFSVEISARGQVTVQNKARLKALAFRCCRDAKLATNLMVKNGSKAALLTSFSLFAARKEPSWIEPPPLVTR